MSGRGDTYRPVDADRYARNYDAIDWSTQKNQAGDKHMATQIESISIRGLRKAHLRQLAAYIEHRDREGWYYGNKDQFEARHRDLVELAAHLWRIADDKDVRIAT